ncbi:MAG: proline iminopeptidase-family hydrolase [Lewinella sp.]|nr:proline iminopeptidase-family hydrolase [Lewinella sp.]
MTRPIKKHLLLLLLALSFQVCNNTAQETHSTEIDLNAYLSPVGDGVQSGGVQVIPIETMGKTFHVWTKRIGNNPTHKLLLLHGGPGATHEYFECLESFFPKEGIELIYYDQLGSGNSDNPDDVSFWDLPRFVDELEQVRKALGLNQDNFFLLGHSWGGILAMEYALKYQDNLKGLIISNMMASAPEYDKYADEVLAKQLKPEVLDTIRMLEANNDFGNPKYMELLMPNFYAEHICRIPIEDWPEPILRSFAKLNQSLYVTMQGPSEFGLSGKLEKWDRTADLPKITVPTLTIGGQYDTMDPEHMKRMATQVKDGTYLYCPSGSHMSMWDDQKTWMDGVINFIQGH